ncbi:NACHT, LRR and PYD domains-containing protein 3-like [Mustelus asterias]
MAESSSRREDPTSSTGMRTDTDSNSDVVDFLINLDDYQLFQFTKFYRDRLEQAIEEGVDGVSSLLTYKRHFSGQEHRKVTELVEKGKRAECSKLLINLVMEKGSLARRVMWESFMNMRHGVPKLDKILKEVQNFGSDSYCLIDTSRGLDDVPDCDKVIFAIGIMNIKCRFENFLANCSLKRDIQEMIWYRYAQQKHKEALRKENEKLSVNTIFIKEEVKIFQLVDRYVELTIISNSRDRTFQEHELLARGRHHEEWREKHLRKELEKIRTDQLFQRSFSQRKSISGGSAAVTGVPGIGKTTMVQKIVYDWATGKIYQKFQFVFCFKFRDLNIFNCKMSISKLVLNYYPYLCKSLENILKNPEGLLFIFDGLDEFRDSIDFADNRRNTDAQSMCTDPDFQCEVSDIVYSLIQHKLLPGCSVLVTSRPTALHFLEKAEISVWAEILGFVGDERKRYFNKFFEDQALAAAVFKHVEENETLYTMCYNPSYCWILGLSLGPFFAQRDKKKQQVPKTITQLYSYYIYNILKNHGRDIESPRDVLLKLGKMAFEGVSEKKIVFRNCDLIAYDLQPCQFISGFLMEILERKESAQNAVYTFPHLTIQEFVAALAKFLTPDPEDMLKLLKHAHSMEDGRFEIFLRFVAGLSSPQAVWLLEKLLGRFTHQTTCQVIDWVKETVEEHIQQAKHEAGKRNLLNTLHYLFESQNKALAQSTVGSMEVLTFEGLRLTPVDCAVLKHAITLCNAIKELHLTDCYIQGEGIQRLGPVLQKCLVLSIQGNNIGDSGVTRLSMALRNPDCKIQNLRLDNNGLTSACAEEFACALRTNKSIKCLSMRNNHLGDSGMKQLAIALRNPDCKIQELGMDKNGLTESCVDDLASALDSNQSLTHLNLNKNNLGASGMKILSMVLGNPNCQMQKLQMENNGLTDMGNKYHYSAIGANYSLMELNLDNNKLGDSGVQLLFAALANPSCKIQKLHLWNNGLTDSCVGDLSSALSVNQSLILLNLGNNKLEDSGMKLLSEALRNRDSKIQELRLWNTHLTDSCAEDLASVLSTNQSLMVLNLGKNKLGDSGVQRLSMALKGSHCKLQELQLSNVGITDCCIEDLTSALSTMGSLTDLSLGSNGFTDKSVPQLRHFILTCNSLKQIRLTWNQFSLTGENELKSLHGFRQYLSVIV